MPSDTRYYIPTLLLSELLSIIVINLSFKLSHFDLRFPILYGNKCIHKLTYYTVMFFWHLDQHFPLHYSYCYYPLPLSLAVLNKICLFMYVCMVIDILLFLSLPTSKSYLLRVSSFFNRSTLFRLFGLYIYRLFVTNHTRHI